MNRNIREDFVVFGQKVAGFSVSYFGDFNGDLELGYYSESLYI